MNSPVLNKRINNMYNVEEVDRLFRILKESVIEENRKANILIQLYKFIRTGSRYGIIEQDIVKINYNINETTIQRLYYAIRHAVNYYLSNHTYKNEIVFDKEHTDVFHTMFEFRKYLALSNKHPHDKPSIVYMGHIIYLFCIGKYSRWFKFYLEDYKRYLDIMRGSGVIQNA